MADKSIPESIFKLATVLDHPMFDSFHAPRGPSILGRESVMEDLQAGFTASEDNPRWTQQRLAARWVPPELIGSRVAAYHDYPCIACLYPCFSERACEALGEFLRPNGELLPVRSETEVRYFFYNITTVTDALNRKASKVDWVNQCFAAYIEHYIFHRNKLKGLSIFRIHEKPSYVLVSDAFVRRSQEAGLNGLDFQKVWPLKRGTLIWKEAKKANIKQRREAERLTKHTLVLRFRIKGRKPSAAEKKKLKQLERELDAQLVVQSLQAPFFGAFEESEVVDQEMRWFLTTPDVDKLDSKLAPWLKNLSWPAAISAVKRYGDRYDDEAKEAITRYRK